MENNEINERSINPLIRIATAIEEILRLVKLDQEKMEKRFDHGALPASYLASCEAFFKSIKQQASGHKLRQIDAGQNVQLTSSQQASSNKPRHFVQCYAPGKRVKNRFRRKI